MTQEEFDARMPVEFWREVVDRVAAEVPDTLLLAEAFWMLEGYFVRTLGMHRVYNSAFMHMLRDEDSAGYRRLIRETLEFDPEILKRYVNFMSNPDEETAIEQFGKGDKYFGVAMVMATLPGLPMLGHGQVEGFGEKYGMEFRRARLDEQPDPWLVERHEREIFPLFHRRSWFAEADDFLLYDLVTDGGGVDEHVLAYSNGAGPTRSLVVYHVQFGSTAGTIRESVPYRAQVGERRQAAGPPFPGRGPRPAERPGDVRHVPRRPDRARLPALVPRDLGARLWLALDAYQGHAFWEFQELHDGSAGQWRRLAERLGGRGVPSLEEALRELQLEPVHGPLRALFAEGRVAAVLRGRAGPADLDCLEERLAALLAAVAVTTDVERRPGGDREPDPAGRRERLRRGARRRAARPGRAGLAPGLAGALAGRCAGARRRCRGHERGLVRRAADGAGRRRRVALGRVWTRGRPGRSPSGSGSCWPCPGRARSAAVAASATCGCSSAGSPTTPSGRRWASTPGRASSGWTASATRRSWPGPFGSMRSRPGRPADRALVRPAGRRGRGRRLSPRSAAGRRSRAGHGRERDSADPGPTPRRRRPAPATRGRPRA